MPIIKGKKKSPPLLRRRAGRLAGWFVLAGIAFFVAMDFYSRFLRTRVEAFLTQALSIDMTLLAYSLVYMFVTCALILAAIIYWLGWDNLKFKLRQFQYRTAMVAKDYYKEYKRVNYDRVMGSVGPTTDGKLDLTGKERDERALSNLDTSASAAAGAIFFKNGKLNGTFVSNFENGLVETEVTYKDGKLDGPYRVYYSDGRLHSEKFYKEGRIDGIFKAYDEDGSIFFEIEYKDGKQEGFDKAYYRSGVLQRWDEYREGKIRHRKTYDENGNLRFEEDF